MALKPYTKKYKHAPLLFFLGESKYTTNDMSRRNMLLSWFRARSAHISDTLLRAMAKTLLYVLLFFSTTNTPH